MSITNRQPSQKFKKRNTNLKQSLFIYLSLFLLLTVLILNVEFMYLNDSLRYHIMF